MSVCSGDDCTHSSHKASPAQKLDLGRVPVGVAPAVLMAMAGVSARNIAEVMGIPEPAPPEPPQDETDKQRNLARAEAKRQRKRLANLRREFRIG